MALNDYDEMPAEQPQVAEAAASTEQEDLEAFLSGQLDEEQSPSVVAPPVKPAAVRQQQRQAPAAAHVQEPQISQHLIALAETVGIPAAEAKTFGSDANLTSSINALLKRLRGPTGPAGRVEAQPAVAAQPPKDELEFADPSELEADQLHPGIVKMAKAMKVMHDRLGKQLEQLGQVVPSLMQDMQARNEERGLAMINEVATDLGIEPEVIRTPEMAQKIARRVVALQNAAREEGEVPADVKTLLRQVVPMLLPITAKGNARTQSKPAPAQRPAPAAAAEEPQRRRFNGQPTGRVTKQLEEEKSALRDLLVDKGIDPGPDPRIKADTADIMNSLLPG